jgi:hypothetical protein
VSVQIAATLQTHTDVLAVGERPVSVRETACKSLIETVCTFKSYRIVFPILVLVEFKATDIKYKQVGK